MLHDLDSNLHSRKHTSWNSDHINQFKDNYRKFAEISVKLKNIEEDQKNTSFLFQSIKQKQKNSTLTKEEAEQERAVLRDKGRQLKLQHTSLMDEYLTLEQVVIFHALRIPNHLHIDTPNDELKELDRCGFPEKVEISNEKLNKTLKKCIKFSNIGRRSYYLMSNAALKEQELITSVSSGLRGSGFTHMVCPEIFKTIPVEGAGITPQDPKEVYKEPKKLTLPDMSWPLKIFPGSSSLLAGPMMWVEQESSVLPGLYGAPQNICAEVAALTRDTTQNEALYDDLQALLWTSLKDQGIPARFVLVPAHSLHCSEKKRTEVQFWSPSLQQYAQVMVSVLLTAMGTDTRQMGKHHQTGGTTPRIQLSASWRQLTFADRPKVDVDMVLVLTVCNAVY
ncbi:Serine--tRNA ligase, mitochondrial [Mizuhopecten yessoensis]|uniref:Serine--tRNA ligase, mitochondrial n=1 Tax=Mizuhopecten yessoensis TaxID=6573 RepID=A0A210PIU7_MIZYE|nr:Serine--tRNA ligase, mitochondrial [Mizuhopecten yessoensis]